MHASKVWLYSKLAARKNIVCRSKFISIDANKIKTCSILCYLSKQLQNICAKLNRAIFEEIAQIKSFNVHTLIHIRRKMFGVLICVQHNKIEKFLR